MGRCSGGINTEESINWEMATTKITTTTTTSSGTRSHGKRRFRGSRFRLQTVYHSCSWKMMAIVVTLLTFMPSLNRADPMITTTTLREAVLEAQEGTISALRQHAFNSNETNAQKAAFYRAEHMKALRESQHRARKERTKERREKSRRVLSRMPKPTMDQLERVPEDQLLRMQNSTQQQRQLWFGSNSGGSGAGASLADVGSEYDKWAQAYRMLGAFIDCDHGKSEDDHHSGDEDVYENAYGCARWMMWAAYVNPNYQGNGYYEYYDENPVGVLDCHDPNTEWKLLGVYRQEFYQFLEQISKHLWAIDDYEYVVALSGLSYMTDANCFQVGQDSSGNSVYAGIQPQPYGTFIMALYSDSYCLEPDSSLGTLDDFGRSTDIDLGSKDATDDDSYSWASEWWYDTQEYTLTQLNEVYQEYAYCTSCVDYPTYQDGYFIGDYGTDDDDLINQCWKFHSHDSYTCEADCIALGHAQGGILAIEYGGTVFGSTPASFYQQKSGSSESTSGSSNIVSSKIAESSLSRLLANAFLTLSFLLFVATFLAFVVARRSRYRESRSSKSRRLLDDDKHDAKDSRSRRSRRSSKSKSLPAEDGDGLFRKSSRSNSKSRSKSQRKTRSSSKDRSRKSSKSSSKRAKSYDPPSAPPKDNNTSGEEYI